MKRTRTVLVSLMMSAFILLGSNLNAADYQPGEVIVKYKEDAGRTRTAMNTLYDAVGVKEVKRFEGMMEGFELLRLNNEYSVEEAIGLLKQSDLVEYAQPNYLLYAFPVQNREMDLREPNPQPTPVPCIPGFDIPNCDPNAPTPCLIPGIPFPPGCEDGGTPPGDPGNPGNPGNPSQKPDLADAPAEVIPPVIDPELSKTYGMKNIQAKEAWNIHQGSKDFVVAVIDTGIDYNHSDLAFNVWRNPNPTEGDVAGYDFIHNDGLPYDDQGHGTHTAGTVGAVGGNGVAVSGVAPRVSIMGLKFLSKQGSGTTADAIRAIDYAVQNGARVLSNSWGGRGDTNNQALYESIQRSEQAGVLFIAAAGNDGKDNDGSQASYPAAFDNENLIAVAATDENDKMAFFSNYGVKSTDLGAPGTNVYSLMPQNRYASHSGTSMACPHVAGAAALVWSKKPELTYKQVKDVLLKSVDSVSSLQGKTVTGGRLNVLKALEAVEAMN